MTPIEELDLLLKIIRKYDLPLSPILEYAVTEKKEENTSYIPVEVEENNISSNTDESFEGTEPTNINIVDFDIPDNADTTTRNKYILQFCYGILSEYKDALDDRERDICNSLLVENRRRRASEEYQITEERVRQIYVKSIKKISHAHNSAMQELKALRQENEELKRRNYLLEKEMKNASNLDNVLSLQELEDSLCNNAKRLLIQPNAELPFSNRTTNILRTAKVEYFKDIPQLTLEEVQKFKNCGKKTIKELREFMSKYSLDFGMTYKDILYCMSKFVDGDFESSLFVYHNLHNWVKKENSHKQIVRGEEFETNEEAEEIIETNENEVEHVFLNSKGKVEGTSTLPVCSESRNGMSWSSEEENLISTYYNNGQSFHAIAKAVGRTEGAVMSRLGKLGLIDYSYGQVYKPKENKTLLISDNNEEVQDFNGMELAERYYYPIQDNLFWDDSNKQVYEIYLADNYELIINHLIFDFNKLNQIEASSVGLPEDEKAELFSNYWYDNHINIIARIKPNTEGYEALKFDSGLAC